MEQMSSQNMDSSCHTHLAGALQGTPEKLNNAFLKVKDHVNQRTSQESQNKISKEKEASEAQKSEKAIEDEGEKDPQNLKLEVKQKENNELESKIFQSGPQQESSEVAKAAKGTEKSNLSNNYNGSTDLDGKDQANTSMSNEDESKNCQLSVKKLRNRKSIQKYSKNLKERTRRSQDGKSATLLKDLKSLVSNPSPGFKTNFNNKINDLSGYINRYKRERQKEISLANKLNDPFQQEDLKEGIKRTRIIKLQNEQN